MGLSNPSQLTTPTSQQLPPALNTAELPVSSDLILNALPAPPPGYSDTPPLAGGRQEVLWPRPKMSGSATNNSNRSGTARPPVADKPKVGGIKKDVESTL